MAQAPKQVRIGTSGWHYAGWIGPFYPKATPKKAMLAAYAERFSTTEINASFYRVPSAATVETWREGTPDGFLFAWKASRFVTHFKQLKDVGENVAFIVDRMAALGDTFGPVLWQLPPRMKADRERLARFLAELPRDRHHAVEFRNPDWFSEAVLRCLSNAGVALCLSDHADAPAPWEVTADHVYIRPHGPGGRYEGRYEEATLGDWAGRIVDWQGEGRAVYCYFDNDVKSAAPFDAMSLRDMVAARGGTVA